MSFRTRLLRGASTLTIVCLAVGLTTFGLCSARKSSKPSKERSADNRKKVSMTKKLFKQAAGSGPITVGTAHVAQKGHYSITGNANGLVTVTDTNTGTVARTFQMTAGVPVRQVFLLDNTQTVGAAQKDHTTFWNLASGNQVGNLQVEAYGFSHDESKFLGYSQGGTALYSFPALQQIVLLSSYAAGPDAWSFPPDDHYVAVAYHGARPSTDSNYPLPNLASRATYKVGVYNATTGQMLSNIAKLKPRYIGAFSADSQFLMLQEGIWADNNQNVYTGDFLFELATGAVTPQSAPQ